MIRLFRSAKLLYVGLIILGCVPITLFFGLVNHNGKQVLPLFGLKANAVLWYILLFGWIFVSAFLAEIYARIKYKKIADILTEECDPTRFILIIEKILKKRNLGKCKNGILINFSTAYLNLEHKDAVKQILDNIGYFANNRLGAINRVAYYNNLFCYYVSIKDLTNAEVVLNYMQESLEDKKLSETDRRRFYILYTEKTFSFQIAKGNFDGAEQIFRIMFEREKSMFAKVTAKFILGQIYLHYGRTEEAKSAFEYVIQHGNKLYNVQKAKQYLQELFE